MNIFHTLFSHFTPSQPIVFSKLAMVPLHLDPALEREVPRSYLTLAEALSAKSAVVREVSASGSVPELSFENRGEQPVLLVEGEELVGAKQNRTLNVTLLAPAQQTLIIPVSCVERGRWSARGGAFEGSASYHHARGRRGKVSSLNRDMRAGKFSRRADQGEVWDEIDAKMSRMRVSSPTAAARELYDHNRVRLDDYLRALEPQPQQLGAVFVIGAEFAGLDLFAHADVFAQMFPKLLQSYALDALELEDTEARLPAAPDQTARALLEAIANAKTQEHPALGIGDDLRFESEQVTGGALLHAEQLLHLAAFRLERAAGPGEPRRASNYRRARERRAQHTRPRESENGA